MEQVTKIVVRNGEIKIHHATKVIDKRDCYAFEFDNIYKGRTDWCVKKGYLSRVLNNQLSCLLYVSTAKFNQDNDLWINKVVEEYNNRYEHYYWYRKPKLVI